MIKEVVFYLKSVVCVMLRADVTIVYLYGSLSLSSSM